MEWLLFIASDNGDITSDRENSPGKLTSIEIYFPPEFFSSGQTKILSDFKSQNYGEKEGFLLCQTPTSTERIKVEGCRVKNGGCR